MIKFLFDNFKNMPVVGGPIKAAYVGSLVKEVIKNGKQSPAKEELLTMGKDDLEDALNQEANNMFDEHITPVITQEGIPAQLVQPIKEKSVDKFGGFLREKVDQAKKEQK